MMIAGAELRGIIRRDTKALSDLYEPSLRRSKEMFSSLKLSNPKARMRAISAIRSLPNTVRVKDLSKGGKASLVAWHLMRDEGGATIMATFLYQQNWRAGENCSCHFSGATVLSRHAHERAVQRFGDGRFLSLLTEVHTRTYAAICNSVDSECLTSEDTEEFEIGVPVMDGGIAHVAFNTAGRIATVKTVIDRDALGAERESFLEGIPAHATLDDLRWAPAARH